MDDTLRKSNTKVHTGNIFTSDYLYHPQDDTFFPMLTKHNILGVEMEAAALYGMGHEHGAQTLAILTITDEIHLKNYNPKSKLFKDPEDKLDFRGMMTNE